MTILSLKVRSLLKLVGDFRNEAELIGDSGVENVRIRSILTCEAKRGVCAKCYGWDLSTHKIVDNGTAVGIRAAQSIGSLVLN